jgi:hypothetical protein
MATSKTANPYGDERRAQHPVTFVKPPPFKTTTPKK